MEYGGERLYIQKFGKFIEQLTPEEYREVASDYNVRAYQERQRALEASRITRGDIQSSINRAEYIISRTLSDEDQIRKAGVIAARNIYKGASPSQVEGTDYRSPTPGFSYGGTDRVVTADDGLYKHVKNAITKEERDSLRAARFTEDPHQTEIPTATSNPMRPRTLAATYDENEQKLTVVFRDGTFYNYYGVTEGEWAKFRYSTSKGLIIAGILDKKDRGPANMDDIDNAERVSFAQAMAVAQIAHRGYITDVSGVLKKKDGTPKRYNPRLTQINRSNKRDQKKAQSRGRKKGRR